jgi:signal transduction histidine kinase
MKKDEEKTMPQAVECTRQRDSAGPEAGNWLSQMAKVIADEIRNPLAGIAGTVSLCRGEMQNQFDDDKLRTIDSCIERIDSFIEDLYLLAKPVRPSYIQIDVSEFIKKVIDQYFKIEEIPCRFKPLDKPAIVWVDVVLLQQALTNLFENAIDAVQDGGEIRVSLERTQTANLKTSDAVIITIADTGVGIDDESVDKLFTPFYTTKHEGRGLGLVIARNYINLHGGNIRIECEKSRGTKALITLPVCTRTEPVGVKKWSWS